MHLPPERLAFFHLLLCKTKELTMPNITKTFVRTAKCDPSKAKQEFYDDTLKGFILEVRPNKRKTFFLRFTNQEKKDHSGQ
jgi:hypothetical protein